MEDAAPANNRTTPPFERERQIKKSPHFHLLSATSVTAKRQEKSSLVLQMRESAHGRKRLRFSQMVKWLSSNLAPAHKGKRDISQSNPCSNFHFFVHRGAAADFYFKRSRVFYAEPW
jgi:hypothetical protein